MYYACWGGHIIFRYNGHLDAIKKLIINFSDICVDCIFLGLKPKENVGLPFLFYLLKENIGTILRKSTASTKTKTVKKEELTLHLVKSPTQSLINKFNSFCESIFELQKQNELIINKLLKWQQAQIESLD